MFFHHHCQKPYEFLLFLNMMIENPMNSYGFRGCNTFSFSSYGELGQEGAGRYMSSVLPLPKGSDFLIEKPLATWPLVPELALTPPTAQVEGDPPLFLALHKAYGDSRVDRKFEKFRTFLKILDFSIYSKIPKF